MAEDKKLGMSENQVSAGFAGKERKEQVKSMRELVDAVKENTESNRKEKDLVDNTVELNTFFEKYAGEFNDLEAQFKQATTLLSDPSTPEAEKQLAEETIETIKENASSEEDRRESLRKEEEANSFLARVAQASEDTAKGFEDFVSNTLAAGGLLATALLFIDPEKFFDILSKAISGALTIIEAISMMVSGDFSGGLEKLKENLGAVTGVIAAGALFFIGPILKGVSALTKGFRSIFNFFKTFNSKKAIGGLSKIFGNIGKLVARLFIPITAVFFAIKGIFEGFQSEGNILEKLGTAVMKAISGFGAFFLDLPKMLIEGILRLFGRSDAADVVSDFDTQNFLEEYLLKPIAGFFGQAGAFLLNMLGFNPNDFDTSSTLSIISSLALAPVNLIKGIISKILGLFGLDNASEALSEFSIVDMFKNIGNIIYGVFDGIVDFFADLLTGESIGDAFSSLATRANEGLKGILRALLPDPTLSFTEAPVKAAAAYLIPESVYEYAGIDKSTGERIEQPEPEVSGDVLNQAQAMAQDQAGMNGNTSTTIIQQSNSPSSSNKTNTTIIQQPNTPASNVFASDMAFAR